MTWRPHNNGQPIAHSKEIVAMPSAWQISSSEPKDWRTTEGIQNLHLAHDIPKPKAELNSTLVHIKAAALNARDMMVVAHDPIYPIETLPGLVPCADGAGIVEEVGPGSKWKPGDRVLLTATSWVDGDVPTLVESAGLGAGAVHGTLREYAVVVGIIKQGCYPCCSVPDYLASRPMTDSFELRRILPLQKWQLCPQQPVPLSMPSSSGLNHFAMV